MTKKWILSLGIISSLALPIGAVISCGDDSGPSISAEQKAVNDAYTSINAITPTSGHSTSDQLAGIASTTFTGLTQTKAETLGYTWTALPTNVDLQYKLILKTARADQYDLTIKISKTGADSKEVTKVITADDSMDLVNAAYTTINALTPTAFNSTAEVINGLSTTNGNTKTFTEDVATKLGYTWNATNFPTNVTYKYELTYKATQATHFEYDLVISITKNSATKNVIKVITCYSAVAPIEVDIISTAFTKDTHYKINSTNQAFLKVEPILGDSAKWTALLDLSTSIATAAKTTANTATNVLNTQVLLKDGANHYPIRFTINATNDAGEKVAIKTMNDNALKALIANELLEKSVERSEGTIKTPDLANAKLSKLWEAKDKVQTDVLSKTAVAMGTLAWSPYTLSETFTVTKTAKVDITDQNGGNIVSQIDGTNVVIKTGITIPADLKIEVLNYWRELEVGKVFTGTGYNFRLDSEMIYQNVYARMTFANSATAATKFIPAKYQELVEIMKLGNGLSDSMLAKRTEYGQDEATTPLKGANHA